MIVAENRPETSLPLVGLIPAGGSGSRLAPLPCSKEILPIGFSESADKKERSPRVACHHLIDSMRQAGVQKAYMILGPGKWDIPAYFGNGQAIGIHLAYLVRKQPFGVPFTLDCAFPFVENCRVACGLPDIIFRPEGAFKKLLHKQEAGRADLVLGIFPTQYPEKWDFVELNNKDKVERIVPKPHQELNGYTWGITVWSPKFGRFMHQFVSQAIEDRTDSEADKDFDEIPLGSVFQAALAAGLLVEHVLFEEGFCLDIGTPEDLEKAMHIQLRLV
jgi:glucose-1-phosphate thymidylyltransferase